jgi:hypothetical protein
LYRERLSGKVRGRCVDRRGVLLHLSGARPRRRRLRR